MMMITVWHSTEGRSMAIHTSQAPVEKKGDYGHQPNQIMGHQPTNATFSRTMIPTRNMCYHLEQGNLINFYFMFTIDSGFSNETHLWLNLLLESNGFSLTLFVHDCKTSNCGSIVTKSGQNHLQLQNPPRDPWPTKALLFSRLLLSFCTHCVLHIIHCVYYITFIYYTAAAIVL